MYLTSVLNIFLFFSLENVDTVMIVASISVVIIVGLIVVVVVLIVKRKKNNILLPNPLGSARNLPSSARLSSGNFSSNSSLRVSDLPDLPLPNLMQGTWDWNIFSFCFSIVSYMYVFQLKVGIGIVNIASMTWLFGKH